MAAEAAPTMYTRGEPGAPDTRGESMVERHQRKIKEEREAGAHAMMKVLLPDAGPALRTLALENCDWDVDRARALIKRFREVKASDLSSLKKEFAERATQQQREEAGKKAAGAGAPASDASGGSSSGDSSASDSESGSDSDGGRGRKSSRHRKKSSHSKRKSKSKSRRKERSSKKSKKRKELRDREDKKAKRHKEKQQVPRSAALTEQYGKYGIIRESDYERKRGDFQLWASEVKKMEVEAMPKWEEKELFKEYCEDYNTGTLAHKKYYDYDAYVRVQAAKDAKKSGRKGDEERTTFNDEDERRRQIAQQRADEIESRKKQAYNELRYTTNKAQEMREQEMLREEMKMLYRTGKMTEARKIQERLNPDEEPGK
mmetsp:Transcript_13660/g.35083  ORF Transcript_13660/g.35083 Transcript_13660/m.35083 type:complete len:373 (-) Transcript_13660:283-1401(-)|eukprot:jgi/Tetstr1/429658/TSEL_019555.t1